MTTMRAPVAFEMDLTERPLNSRGKNMMWTSAALASVMIVAR